jgi:hypothetical protein
MRPGVLNARRAVFFCGAFKFYLYVPQTPISIFMYPENPSDPTLNLRGEKPFEPTSIELRKQYNTLDSLIRMRSNELTSDNGKAVESNNQNEDDNDGFIPPFNSAF